MAKKLSPGEFPSITDWIKQFVGDGDVEPERKNYKIEIVQPENGTIGCNYAIAHAADPIVCTFTPNDGYQVVGFYVNGEESKLTFSMPAKDIVLTGKTEWIMYGTLTAPEITIVSRDATQVIYSVKNPNDAEVKFNGETINPNSALELTHIWGSSEESFLIDGYLEAEHWINSPEVSEIVYNLKIPVKGDIIQMSLGNAEPAAGTNNQYRVLNINGTVAEVVAMFDISTSQQFNPSESGQVYSGSSLDTALNTTWYDTLSTTAKAAIVPKTVNQTYASFTWSVSGSAADGRYIGIASDSDDYMVTVSKSVSVGSRNVYALDLIDIMEYLEVTKDMVGSNTTLNYTNIWKMFWNTTSRPSNYTMPWLRSARASLSSYCWYVNGSNGCVNISNCNNSNAARPAFKIDLLSKIHYSIVE